MRKLFIVCLLLTGCLQQPHGTNKPVAKKHKPIVSPTPVIPVQEVTLDGDVVANLSRYLGAANTVTLKSPLILHQATMSIQFPAGTTIDYVTNETSCLFTFHEPLPTITVKQWGMSLHPVLKGIELTSPNKGVATVKEGLLTLRKSFVLDWEDETKPKTPTAPDFVPVPLELPEETVKPRQTPKPEAAPTPQLPTMWAFGDYSDNSTCVHCKDSHKDLVEYQKHHDMPCVVIWNPKGIKQPVGVGTPYFAWARKGELTPSGTKSDWKLEGWWGVDYLLKEFQRTRQPNQPQSPAKVAGLHSHRCNRCGTIWSHGREAAGNPLAHSCPKCGTKQYDVYQ